MFARSNTAMIFGAGANWHYGYPTGEELVKQVIHAAYTIADLIQNNRVITWGNLYETKYIRSKITAIYHNPEGSVQELIYRCNTLAEKLTQVNPPVIDYFLEKNPELQEVGQMMIALVLLRCEAENILRDHKSDWHRFLTYQLSLLCKSPEDLSAIPITFITFNYDISLERNLYKSLSSIEFFNSTPKCVDGFFDATRFLHIYGKLKQNFKTELNEKQKTILKTFRFDSVFDFMQIFDLVFECSQGICTINGINKKTHQETIDLAIETLRYVDTIYILGYGFDQNNNDLLKLPNIFRDHKKRVFFTNFEDNNIVNKRASNLFFNSPLEFMPNRDPIIGDWQHPPYVEKSTRTVYEALQRDFDLQAT